MVEASDGASDYALLPNTEIEVREITESFATTLAGAIRGNDVVRKLEFPRLQFPRMKCLHYRAGDYLSIADKIGPDKILVLETRYDQYESGIDRKYLPRFSGRYQSWPNGLHYFVLTPSLTGGPRNHMETIVHEVTHAIQDWKEWRTSPRDREVDAHFAGALYLVRAGRTGDISHDPLMTNYVKAAREYDRNPAYLASQEFSSLHRRLRAATFERYQEERPPAQSVKDFRKLFRRRRRTDGLPDLVD